MPVPRPPSSVLIDACQSAPEFYLRDRFLRLIWAYPESAVLFLIENAGRLRRVLEPGDLLPLYCVRTPHVRAAFQQFLAASPLGNPEAQ